MVPRREYRVDDQDYVVWRYVTHSANGMRRFMVLVSWTDEGASETLLAATLVSEVLARDNSAGVTTTVPYFPGAG